MRQPVQVALPLYDGTPAQVGSPWREGDRCQLAKTEPEGPVGRILELRHNQRCYTWRARVEWPDGDRWHDLNELCFLEDDER